MLEEAIKAEGLGHLVSGTSAEVVSRATHMIKSGVTIENYDPLLWCHWAIVSRIASQLPEIIFIRDCPICWITKQHEETCDDPNCEFTKQTFEDWIPSIASVSRIRYQRLQKTAAAPNN